MGVLGALHNKSQGIFLHRTIFLRSHGSSREWISIKMGLLSNKIIGLQFDHKLIVEYVCGCVSVEMRLPLPMAG
jgi:hypothetical protein